MLVYEYEYAYEFAYELNKLVLFTYVVHQFSTVRLFAMYCIIFRLSALNVVLRLITYLAGVVLML